MSSGTPFDRRTGAHETNADFRIEWISTGSKSTTEIVNDLLGVLEDDQEGFHKAAQAVNDPSLKRVLSNCASQRAQMAEDLLLFTFAERKEGRPAVAKAMHRGWSNLKAALTSGDDDVILSECEHGENRAVEAFKEALAGHLPDDMCEKIKSQAVHILEAHNKIMEWRDVACTRS